MAFRYVREFLAVDFALDSGASYDYRTGRADFTQSHPYIPFTERHGIFLTLSAWSAFAAVAYAAAVAIWRRLKPS